MRIITQDHKHNGLMLSVLQQGIRTEMFFLFADSCLTDYWPDFYKA